jgi:hypothetical protein
MKVMTLAALAVSMSLGLFARWHPDTVKPGRALQDPQNESTSKSTVVYVSDFELEVAPQKDEKPSARGNTTAASGPDEKKKETAAEQAKRLVDGLASNLASALENAGYTVHRLRPGDPRPETGVRIQGVFTQVDEQSRLRKAIIGSGLEPAGLQVFFCVGNLARPDQEFYEITGPKSADNKFGPIITVSPYAPVAKFDVDREANDLALKDLSAKMVADLMELLKANPMATSS